MNSSTENANSQASSGAETGGFAGVKGVLTTQAIVQSGAILAFFLVGVRILAVANRDIATATVILNAGGYASILISQLLFVLPIVILYLAYLTQFYFRTDRTPGGNFQFNVQSQLTLLAVFLVPWPYVAWTTIALVARRIRYIRRQRRRPESVRDASQVESALIVATFIVPLLIVTLMSSAFWLPAEVIKASGGQQTLGYVLEDEGDWTTVLRDSDRRVIYVASDSITERSVCSNPEFLRLSSSFFTLISSERTQPPCPVKNQHES